MKTDTRQRLIDTFYDDMYTYGYQGVVLDDVLAKAKVHKGSMYHFFKSKKELALAAIKETSAYRLENIYLASLPDTPPYLPSWFAKLHDTSIRDFKRGCPVANIIQEMSNIDDDFNTTMAKVYDNTRQAFKKVYDMAVSSGELRECDTAKLGHMTLAVIEGAILSVKASANEADFSEAIDMLEEYILSFHTSAIRE